MVKFIGLLILGLVLTGCKGKEDVVKTLTCELNGKVMFHVVTTSGIYFEDRTYLIQSHEDYFKNVGIRHSMIPGENCQVELGDKSLEKTK